MHIAFFNLIEVEIVKREEPKQYLTYVDDVNELIKHSDLITLHLPYSEELKYMVDDAFLAKMKDNAILINAARGMLVDTKALLRALDSGKLLGAGIDVYENEHSYVPRDFAGQDIDDAVLKELIRRDDVIYTPHTAFFTNVAIKNTVEMSLDAAVEVLTVGNSENLIV